MVICTAVVFMQYFSYRRRVFIWSAIWSLFFFFFSSRRRHTRWTGDWSSDVCSSDLRSQRARVGRDGERRVPGSPGLEHHHGLAGRAAGIEPGPELGTRSAQALDV